MYVVWKNIIESWQIWKKHMINAKQVCEDKNGVLRGNNGMYCNWQTMERFQKKKNSSLQRQ